MLKKTLLTFGILQLLVLVTSFTNQPKQTVLKTIIIDAGHGGADQGAEGLEATEARICMEISKRLGAQLEKEIPDVKILYTRTANIFPGNSPTKKDGDRYRASFANQSNADLFISIHCNSAGKSPGGWNEKKIVDYKNQVSYVKKKGKKVKMTKRVPIYENFYVLNEAKGTETYIWTAAENSHKEQMVGLNEFSKDGENETTEANDAVTTALKLIYTKKYFAKSLQLAELVQQEFEKSGRINRGVKQRNEKGIWVLHATGMPSILVETGFISNKEEEQFLLSNNGQAEISQNITNAVKNYIAALQGQQKTMGRVQFNNKERATLAFLDAIEQKERKN
jgi:N-acetylmuramoyl-L-alanine amidase